ncbi:MAG: ATP-binding protein [Mycobacteriales bacterium]
MSAGGADRDGAELVLPPVPGSVHSARRFVLARCRQLVVDPGTAEDLVLLTSEVVTNAIIHGRSEVRLRVLAGQGRLRIEVADENSRHPQLPGEDADALDGRGVRILDELAARWGVRDERYGKTVWFELRSG